MRKKTRSNNPHKKTTEIACNIRPKCSFNKFITPDGKQCVEIKYIGKGSYGCVISPPVSDDTYILKTIVPYTDKDNSDVAKLFFKTEAFKEELKYAKLINKIDPQNKFTVKVKGAQRLSGKCIQLSDSIMYCLRRKIRDTKSAKFNQMIMENGGVSLNSQTDYSITYIKFLNMFKEFIAGMITLQKFEMIHRDIKPHNVLFDMKKNKLNLIDFGLMCQNYTELYDGRSENMSLLEAAIDYPYYPPEFYVAYIMLKYRYYYDNNEVAFNKLIDSIYDKMQSIGFFEQDILSIDHYLRQEYQYGVKSFLEAIRKSGYIKCSDIFTRDVAMKADVFSVASLLVSLSSHIRYENISQQQFIEYLIQKCHKANPYERASFIELYSLINSEQMRSNSQGRTVAMSINRRPVVNDFGSRYHKLRQGGNTSKSTFRTRLSSKLDKLKSKLSSLKSKVVPYMVFTVSKMRNIFNKDYATPQKGSRSRSHSLRRHLNR